MVREITSASEFATAKNVPNLVVVDYYATWCGPCKAIAPVLEQLAGRYPDVVFLKELIMANGVGAFPTFQYFLNGNKVDELKGANARELENKIIQHKANAKGVFDGPGATLGGGAPAWDGIGMPPGSNDRAARLAKFGHIDAKKSSTQLTSKPVSVAAPAPATSKTVDEDDEEAEIAKAIALSMASLDSDSAPKDGKANSDNMEQDEDADGDEMVPVPVNQEHLAMLLEMGMSDVRARKGLVHGGNVEGAVVWISEHQDDPDIDQEYLVRKRDTIPKTPLTEEERAAKMQALKDKAARLRREAEEKEKQDSITREKERRMRGQQLNETQEVRERMLRKLEAEKIKREKMDDKREKERIKAQILADKEERRRNGGMLPSALGVDGYNPSIGGPSPAVSAAAQSTPSSAGVTVHKPPQEIIEASIGTISRYRTGGDGGNALKLLVLFLKNIAENPNDEKYRSINTESKAFKAKLAPLVGPMAILKAVGFINGDDGKLHFEGDDMCLLESTLAQLTKAEEEYRQRNPGY